MRSLLVIAVLFASPVLADEGMWTFDALPMEALKKAGIAPDEKWLEHVRLSSLRLSGCSSGFVSPGGLLMTNHHCVRACIQQLSTPTSDLLATGFSARSAKEERTCPAIEAVQLQEIRDVTDRVEKALANKSGPDRAQALKSTKTAIEEECAKSARERCDVVTLFQGARYHLYRYRRFQDVRLVFAPEFRMAAFGGYPDNFHFPRYGMDVAFLRVWEDGKPVPSPHYFRWSQGGSAEGDWVFVPGHPGGTERKLSVSDLAFQRDVELPWHLLLASEQRAMLRELLRQKPRLEPELSAWLRSVENRHKAWIGRQQTLADFAFLEQRRVEEQALREKIKLQFDDWEQYHQAFDDVAGALERYRPFLPEHRLLEKGDAFESELFAWARELVRAAREKQKPSSARLREYTEAAWPQVTQRLFAARPVSLERDEALLQLSLEKLRERLGAEHPAARALLKDETPQALARRLVRGSRLGDPKLRQKLLEGGVAAVERSTDPMLRFARAAEPFAMAQRERYEREVEPALERGRALIARAKIQAEGLGTYPDATGTLRLSYGQVKGWEAPTGPVAPFTTFGGLKTHATGAPPFALAPTWQRGLSRVPPQTPLNLVTTNDTIGGNSGSPLLNREAEIVGLIFDGNLPSLGGRYTYDAEHNRAVAVDSRAILAALEHVYRATRVLEELRSAR